MPENSSASIDPSRSNGQPRQKDKDYFMDDVFVVFQVERKLFRVPIFMFKESEVFRGMFSLPQLEECNVEGTSEENPIVLPDQIGAEAFKQLLRVLYPNRIILRQPPTFNADQLVSILKLSTQWYFFDARKFAIKYLKALIERDKIGLAKRVLIGREGRVAKWIEKAYICLIQRTQSISDPEASEIGWRTSLALLRIRETILQNRIVNYNASMIRSIVKTTFADELKKIRLDEAEYQAKRA
ncbi:hypothetical protein CPB83DRAFT_862214 [Crepidotus variabilis]|uniref:BTB domain-containing protein n=1 Tax=Crepidotus variabilis TaxID=179855 RepID=A0A9P6E7E8_9AGAR|nr:hypothetical protein CPB83DRAFT_862214 [Crepidotus variabilis]